jgi:uncharacterized protein YbjT (DUF2867 family)
MAGFTVFGGTGFLGRRIVERLAAEGALVRLAVRHPVAARSSSVLRPEHCAPRSRRRDSVKIDP